MREAAPATWVRRMNAATIDGLVYVLLDGC